MSRVAGVCCCEQTWLVISSNLLIVLLKVLLMWYRFHLHLIGLLWLRRVLRFSLDNVLFLSSDPVIVLVC